MKKEHEEQKKYPAGPVPKAVKVENMASFLKITFDNGEEKYLRSHINKDVVKHPFTREKANGKRTIFFAGPRYNWIGAEFEIMETGEVIMNGTDHYSPEELWYDSDEHVWEAELD